MVQLICSEMGYSGRHMDVICNNSPDGAIEAAEEYTRSLLENSTTPCSTYTSVDEISSKDDSGDMMFCMGKYSKDVLKMMYMMRSHHMLTDVILEVEKELFHVHKVVLSAASPYFKAMFTGGLKESEMSRVHLQGICPTAMGRMIYFMYTGNIRVTEVTVCQLLPAATMFQVPYVVEACCAFLERQLDPTNAIGISSFAEQHSCESLKQKANQFIERNFTQICQEEEFLQLSAIQLIGLIRKDELNVQGEREVYNAVLNWVKYDEDNRHPRMEHILYAVRCQLLPPSFLNDQMKNCEVLRRAPNCRRYLEEIFKDLTLHKRPAVKERRPNTKRMIFVAGGYLRGSLDVVEAFNVDDKTWTTLPPLRVPRSGLGSAFLKGNFYAVGGRNNTPGASFDSDWVDRYNPLNEMWRPCSPMTVPRHRSGVAVMDELLYAVGGSAGSEYHSSVEYFDPEEDRWTLVQPMHSKRFGVGVAVVNRLLYAIGGFDGNDRLASMECYHPENNAWTVLPSMKLGRSGAGVAALNQHIYVVGGFDGQHHLATVERFDTEQQTWEMVAEIKTPRSALSLTVLDGKLFAMGGFDGQNFLTIVEVYDPAKNEWEEGTPLTSGRSGHASAVIYHPACPSGTHQDVVPVSVTHKKPGMADEPMATDAPGGGSGGGRGGFNGMGEGSHNNAPINEQHEAVNRPASVPISRRGSSLVEDAPPPPPQAEMANRPATPLDTPGPALAVGVVMRGGITQPPPPVQVVAQNVNPICLPGMVNGGGGMKQPEALPSTSQRNPFKKNLLDMNLLKSMCENMSQGSSGLCSYFNNSGNSSQQAAIKQKNNHSHHRPPPQQALSGGQLLTDLSQAGMSSRGVGVQQAMAVSSTTPSPPIRIAKKREADSPNIPCTPPKEFEIKMRVESTTYDEKDRPGPAASSSFNSGVKTFLPVVDFQNQRKYRRKINPTPIRHPSYNRSNNANDNGHQPMEADSSGDEGKAIGGPTPPPAPVATAVLPPPPPPPHGRCAAMHKIKEVVRQKLFSPSMLLSPSSSSAAANSSGNVAGGSSSSHGSGMGGKGGSSSTSYQDKLRMNRSDLITNRRSVLCNVNDDSSESDNPMDDGR